MSTVVDHSFQGVSVTRKKTATGKRDYSKRYACYICGQLVLSVPKHLEKLIKEPKHKECATTLKSLKPKSRERREFIQKFRSSGNFKHNSTVMNTGAGHLILKSRPKEAVSPSHVTSCIHCGETYRKAWYNRHQRECRMKPQQQPDLLQQHRLPALNLSKFMAPKRFSEVIKAEFEENVYKKIRDDDRGLAAKADPLIKTFGLELMDDLGEYDDPADEIRNKMRELGRLVLALKGINKDITCLEDALTPDFFEDVIEATRQAAEYDNATRTFKVPSLAKRIGESLQKCVIILKKRAIVEKNEDLRKNLEDFLALHAIDWSKKINRKAHLNLQEIRYNKPTQLPDKEDAVKLVDFIKSETEKTFNQLKDDPTNAVLYSKLTKLILASVIIFNRKRPGDVSKLKVALYTKENSHQTHLDIYESLDDTQKKLVNSLKRVETTGKKSRKMVILFTPRFQEIVGFLINVRDKCSIPKENPYVFATTMEKSYVRGTDAIRFCRDSISAKHPERLTATTLRKEASTLAKVAGLTEQEVEELAEFMGHTLKTHKKSYRLPEGTLQTASVSQYLLKLYGSGPSEECCSRTDEDDDHHSEDSELPVPPKKRKPRWTTEEKEVVISECRDELEEGHIPTAEKCRRVQRKLRRRKPSDVKNFCRNLNEKKKLHL